MGSCRGNATEAAKAAGYKTKGAHVTGCRLLKDVKVRQAIEARVRADPKVLEREQIQQWLSAIVVGQGVYITEALRDRISAAKELNRMQGGKAASEAFDHEAHLAAIEQRRLAGKPLALVGGTDARRAGGQR